MSFFSASDVTALIRNRVNSVNLTPTCGFTGPSGTNGSTGATGATGTPGTPGNSTGLIYYFHVGNPPGPNPPLGATGTRGQVPSFFVDKYTLEGPPGGVTGTDNVVYDAYFSSINAPVGQAGPAMISTFSTVVGSVGSSLPAGSWAFST